ncbi:hypothetical protein BC831DRAFT_515146 [Entophlyctis helioformis]|nr:hypothetical protein BC831DRAFT_515146 [Entophlyctis helioformis]
MFGGAPKVSRAEAVQNRKAVRSTLFSFVATVAAFQAVPVVIELVKELLQ